MLFSGPLLTINNGRLLKNPPPPNNIGQLNLGSLLYNNSCNDLTTFSTPGYNSGITVFNDTFVVPTNVYGYFNPNINLLNKTIMVNMKTDVLGDIFFGCNSSGLGLMFRFETRNQYSSGIADTTDWTNWNAPSSGPTLLSNTYYTVIISINLSGNVKWAVQQLGTNSFVNNTIYVSNASHIVNSDTTYIGLQGDGGGGSSVFDSIQIYNYATL